MDLASGFRIVITPDASGMNLRFAAMRGGKLPATTVKKIEKYLKGGVV